VERASAQVATPYKSAKPPGDVAELDIMADCDFQSLPIRKVDQFLRFLGVYREWFLDIDVTPILQAELPKAMMTPRRCRDVNDFGVALLQHFFRIPEVTLDPKSLSQLLRHQWFPIAGGDNLALTAILNLLNLIQMIVRNLAAPYDGYPKQDSSSAGNH
jgi:hypothetical protein